MELVLGMGTLPLKRLPKSQEFADWDAAVDIFRGKRAGSLEDVIAAINTIRAEARRQLTPRELRKKWPLDKIIDVIQKRIRAEEY